MSAEKPPPQEPNRASPVTLAGDATPGTVEGAVKSSLPEPEKDWETRFKYLLADFENFRKRGDRDRESASLRAEAQLLRGLLPIHEAFERAREAVGRAPASDPVRKGMELLSREWERFLKREGVEPVATPGGAFRAEDHEAVAEAPVGPREVEGTIHEVVQQGYRFRGGLLRAAKVVVARSPAEPSATGSSADAGGDLSDPGSSD